MGIEKDTTFKYIGKNFFEIFLNLANLSENIDATSMQEVTEELVSLKISQFRPDFIGNDGNVILMIEYESSYVGKQSQKRFHTYVALYDYNKNEEDLDIIFLVLSTKEESKVVEYKIGDIDTFKIIIFNIKDLGFEKILSNANNKIRNNEIFDAWELVPLALTSLMPGTRKGNIKQFHELHNISEKIKFKNDDVRTSFFGLLLLLSNIYFDKDDLIRKKIQSDFMNKIDCIVEMRQEQYEAGMERGMERGIERGIIDTINKFLSNGFSLEAVSKGLGLSVAEIKKLLKEVK